MATAGGQPLGERPLFRTDLVCTAVDEGDQRYVDVAVPGSGARFRLYEIEFAIACGFDGSRDLDEVAAWAGRELGVQPERGELEAVVSTLAGQGCLTAGDAAGADEVELGAYRAAAPAPLAARDEDTEPEVELGAPGRAVAGRGDVPTPVAGVEIELGQPGPPVAAAPRAAAHAEVELGAPGRSSLPDVDDVHEMPTTTHRPLTPMPEAAATDSTASASRPAVSADLSEQFEVGTEDVKEAVRHSRTIQTQAQSTPPDVASDYDDEPMTINSMMSTVDTGADPDSGAATLSDDAALAASARAKPVVLPAAPMRGGTSANAAVATDDARPSAPARSERAASTTDAPRTRSAVKRGALRVVVLALLLFVVALSGIYVYLKYYADRVGAPPPPRTSATQPRPAPIVAPAVRPSVPLTPTAAEPVAALAARAGVVDWIAEKDATVAAGDPIAKLAGVTGVERELARAQERLKTFQDEFNQAAARGDKAAMKAAEIDSKRKQADIDKAQAKLAELVVTAPAAGAVEPAVAARARIAAGAEVAKVVPAPALRATLPTGASGGAPPAVGAELALPLAGQAGDGGRALPCKVVEVKGGSTVVECTSAGPLPADAAVLAP